MKFEIVKNSFVLNGKQIKIISGAVHYFRNMPDTWHDIFKKLKAMGCNCVETYCAWNMHEKRPDVFDFSRNLDIASFIKIAQEEELMVIVRPGPYICAEWEFGGLPAWLLAEDGMKLRVNYGPFLKHVEDYYKVLLPKITPLQVTNGGPVILMQIENEYGYYANDITYLEAMRKLMTDQGVNVPMVTSDGPYKESMNAGKLPGAVPTGNFGSKTEERFELLQQYTDGGPLMCTEFWVGWFDHWGNGGHMRGNLEESVRDLDKMLEMGHVNIYMFQGGTNFGFMNGSNYNDGLTPDVTSYDYDAVLSEDGQITEKYRRYKEVIAKYTEIPEVEFSMDIQRKAYGELKVLDKVSLSSTLDKLSTPVESIFPQSMERLGQNYGYILYRTKLHTEDNIGKIRLWGANDRANILVDDQPVVTLYDRELLVEHKVNFALQRKVEPVAGSCGDLTADHPVMDILMENMGRVNFGPCMDMQRKGIDHCVQINGHMQNHWQQYTLPLDDITKVDFSGEYKEGTPAFYRFAFDVEECCDTFLDFEGWGKGCVFVNGFNIGRFWEIGPQKRLYIPGPLLKTGENEIIIFETDGKVRETITLKDEPDIG